VGCTKRRPPEGVRRRKPGNYVVLSVVPGPEPSAARVIFVDPPLLSHSRRKSLPAVEAHTLLVMIPLEWL
jgi:hypothetical protein